MILLTRNFNSAFQTGFFESRIEILGKKQPLNYQLRVLVKSSAGNPAIEFHSGCSNHNIKKRPVLDKTGLVFDAGMKLLD